MLDSMKPGVGMIAAALVPVCDAYGDADNAVFLEDLLTAAAMFAAEMQMPKSVFMRLAQMQMEANPPTEAKGKPSHGY